jgi:hypothetical protein
VPPPGASRSPGLWPGPGAPLGARAGAGSCASASCGRGAGRGGWSPTPRGVQEARARRPGPRGPLACGAASVVCRPSGGPRLPPACGLGSRRARRHRVAGLYEGLSCPAQRVVAPVGLVCARLTGHDEPGAYAPPGARAPGARLAPAGGVQTSGPWGGGSGACNGARAPKGENTLGRSGS